MSREAAYYEPLDNNAAACRLCPHNCVINPGQSGLCGVRANDGGRLYANSYGLVSSYALDPIEKKPLYHFFPGSRILSLGNVGCNMRCAFCQNYGISTAAPDENAQYLTPPQVAVFAEKLVPDGNIGVAYTYNEPLIGYEFVTDCAARVREKGLKNVLVTNGYIQPEPFLALLPLIDALNIDLKSFSDDFYRRAGGDVETVKENIKLAAGLAHVEVTTLIIPGENDADGETDALARFIAGISPDIPLHLSRFFPKYKMSGGTPTPRETILRLAETARRHLTYVYTGNM